MSQYQLRPGQEAFEVVDGTDAGRVFHRGKSYPTVPAGYESRFEKITPRKSKPDGAGPKGQPSKVSTIVDTSATTEETKQ